MSPRGRPRGRSRRRAEPRNAREAIEALLDEELGRRGFPISLEAEAERAASSAEGDERRDLTGLPTFTVDPATARDFDDAVSARREGEATRLWIHIADVAAHVRPGSSLDREARRRGNSTYVPGTVEPMLPRALSEDACSLSPGVERLAVTAEIDLDPDGAPREASFYRSRIRSDARLDYDQLDVVFSGRTAAPEQVAEPLALARDAAARLGRQRNDRRGLTVETAEPEFRFDRSGDVVGARAVPQTESHSLIERLMILTNEQVAQLLERRRVPAIYRVHGEPDPPRVERMIGQLHALGIPTPPLRGSLAPREAGQLAAEASRLVAREASRRGHGREAYTSLVLRSLQQAGYSDRNTGHAGLGSAAYCHFTSPIRRYPDLVVHRALLRELGLGDDPLPDDLPGVAEHASEREREAAKLEYLADEICLAWLLEERLRERGWEEPWQGEIIGHIGAGLFARFGEVFEGFLPARRLPGEFFELNVTGTALAGRRTGRTYRLGDPIEVRVESVSRGEGQVELALAERGGLG